MRITTLLVGVLSISSLILPLSATAQETLPTINVAHAGLKKLGWQLACRGDTFRSLSTFEMIDQLHKLNIHHIELSPNQMLSANHSDVKIGDEMTADQVAVLTTKLKSVGMDVVSYGIAGVPPTQADGERLFKLAKLLKAKNIVIQDPPEDSLPMLDALAQQNSINIAIVSTSHPDVILAKLRDRSARVGICAEPAEWRRAGTDPVAAVQVLGKRVIEIHLQDFDAQAVETPLGAGTANLGPVLQQLKDENFHGICCVSYQSGSGTDLLTHFITSVNWLSDRVNELAGTQ